MIRALEFRDPDRMPVFYHRSPAGLHVHGQKLLDLFKAFPPDNPFDFTRIPAPPPDTVGADGAYHEIVTDEWGCQWEYHVFGLQGSVRRFPVMDLDKLCEYRFPLPPSVNDPDFAALKAEKERLRQEFLLIDGWILLFEKAMEIRPPEEVLMDIAAEDPRLAPMLDGIDAYNLGEIEYLTAAGSDVILFGDDWGTQQGPFISPNQFNAIFKPRYRRYFDAVRKKGGRILFHCCGKMGRIFDELAGLGINCIWHQTNLYDPGKFAEECRSRNICALIHPDRQRLMPRGTPAEIREAVARFADIYHRQGGGGIFYVEIENDCPFENAEALVRAVRELG